MRKLRSSPLTRILHRELTGYTLEELDKADIASLTIPEFKDILMKNLDTDLWPDKIYISEDDE